MNDAYETPRILVVEDEKAIASLLEKMLALEGFEVAVARNGKDGIDAALSCQPQLIIADVLMPVMDGISMISYLRRTHAKCDTPVILYSNLSPSELTQETKGLDIEAFLPKAGTNITELLSVIRRLISTPRQCLMCSKEALVA